jgi:hypothetical protein
MLFVLSVVMLRHLVRRRRWFSTGVIAPGSAASGRVEPVVRHDLTHDIA